MARLRRVVLPGLPHLIIHRGQSDAAVFVDTVDRTRYLHGLRDAARESAVEVHAYGLASGEVRLLVTPSTTGGLAQLMQSVGRRFVLGYNRRHGRSGSPWEGRFRSTVIEAERYFVACLRFVEAVEQHAEATQGGHSTVQPVQPVEPVEPAWSSAAHHLGSRIDPVITDHPAFWALGNTPFEREAAYRRLFQDHSLPLDMAKILQASLHGWALGSPAFATTIGETSGRRSIPASPGRPRKTVR